MSASEISMPTVVVPGLVGSADHDCQLFAGHCPDCGRWTYPAPPLCPSCRSRRVASEPIGPEGTIYTFTVVRSRPPDYRGPVPYALGLVELPEGIRISGLITADDVDLLAIGDHVRLRGVDVGGDEPWLTYAFERVGAEGGSHHG